MSVVPGIETIGEIFWDGHTAETRDAATGDPGIEHCGTHSGGERLAEADPPGKNPSAYVAEGNRAFGYPISIRVIL